METKKLRLTQLIDMDVLRRIQKEFSLLTGMTVIIIDENCIPVIEDSGYIDYCRELNQKCELVGKKCLACNKTGILRTLDNGKPVVYECHAFLKKCLAPIVVEGKILGAICLSQVVTEKPDLDRFRRMLQELGMNPEDFMDMVSRIKVVSEEDISKNADLAGFFASVISDMAYGSYLSLKKNELYEENSRVQKNYTLSLNSELISKMCSWVGDISDSSFKEKYLSIINQLEEINEYIKLSDGKSSLSENVYNIRLMMSSLSESFLNQGVDRRGVDIELVPSVPSSFFGDSVKLSQVILKLVNCITILSGGRGRVSIAVDSYKSSYAENLCIAVSSSELELEEDAVARIKDCVHKRKDSYLSGDGDVSFEISIINLIVEELCGHLEFEYSGEKIAAFTLIVPQLEIEE